MAGVIGTPVNNSNRIRIEGNVPIWQTISASNIFIISRGFAGVNGITGTSMMLRNRDWGAVAYLTHSRYGRNGTRITINNNEQSRTGFGGDTPTAAATNNTANAENRWYGEFGRLASTTGNTYGIYDMAGGLWEYVAAYVNNGNANLTTHASAILNADTRYKDRYVMGATDTNVNNYNANAHIYGNAVFETSLSGNSISGAWFGARTGFPSALSPVFLRRRSLGPRHGYRLFHILPHQPAVRKPVLVGA